MRRTLEVVTLTAAGTSPDTASLVDTLGAATLASTGSVSVVGNETSTLDGATSIATGLVRDLLMIDLSATASDTDTSLNTSVQAELVTVSSAVTDVSIGIMATAL